MPEDVLPCRCFVPGLLSPGRLELPEDESRHLVRVRRHRSGDPVLVLNGKGQRGDGRILEADRESCVVEILQVESVTPLAPHVTLVIGALKTSAWEELLPHLAELGVARIIRWQSDHAVSDVTASKRASKSARWRERLIQACKQSANPWLPEVDWADEGSEILARLPEGCLHVFADLGPDVGPFHALTLDRSRALVAWVGPEGDFSPAEREWIRSVPGMSPVSLGATVLRAETAALSLVTLLRLGG